MSDSTESDSAGADPDGRLSWEVGPDDSRPIRVLVYFAEGLLGGVVLSALFSTVEAVRPTPLDLGPWSSGLVAVFVLLVLGRLVWFYAIVRVAADHSGRSDEEGGSGRAGESPTRWASWTHDQQWRWPIAVALAIGAGLVALGPDPQAAVPDDPVWLGVLLLAVGCSALAELLTSEGRIDADSLTLTTYRYREWREVDLRTLTSVRRVSVGPFEVLWLSVAPGVEKRTTVQGFYAIPTRILERAWTAFEAGLAADSPIDDETAERARFFRKVNRVVAGGVLLLAVGGLLGLAWVGGAIWNVLAFAWLVVGAGVFFLKLAA